ncbi:MAG: nucleoside deaminase [Desulfobulbaceae bacterium]|nr:nucleoside deaminase [Desulfobulbaceae bacterium]
MEDNTRHEQNMLLALALAEKTLAQGEFPVGCVFVRNGEVIAQGARQNSRGSSVNEIDHAEILTLRSLLRREPDIDLGSVTVYSTMEPCLMCYSTMLLSGIREFVWAYEDVMGGGCNLDLSSLPPLYAEMRVTLQGRIMRNEALRLFQYFFKNFHYWQDSLLSRYTLAQ